MEGLFWLLCFRSHYKKVSGFRGFHNFFSACLRTSQPRPLDHRRNNGNQKHLQCFTLRACSVIGLHIVLDCKELNISRTEPSTHMSGKGRQPASHSYAHSRTCVKPGTGARSSGTSTGCLVYNIKPHLRGVGWDRQTEMGKALVTTLPQDISPSTHFSPHPEP